MGVVKRISEKILQKEIKELKEKVEQSENGNIKLCREIAKIEEKYRNQLSEVGEEKYKEVAEKIKAKQKAQELEKENEILRKYYDLDKEPSDEIKAKIHIDLEINRLKEEKLQLIVMCNRQPVYIPQPYPVYGFGRGFM